MGKNEADSSGGSVDLDDEIQKAMSEAEAAVTAMQGDEEASADEAQGGAANAELIEDLERAKANNAGLRDKWLRAVADHENYRKRVKRDVEDSIQQATLKLLESFLPTVDNLERALGAATEQDTKLVEGIQMVTRDFLAALAKHDITPVESVGRPFDPSVHDALQQVDSPDHAPGVVVQEFEKGYVRGGRLLVPPGSSSRGRAPRGSRLRIREKNPRIKRPTPDAGEEADP